MHKNTGLTKQNKNNTGFFKFIHPLTAVPSSPPAAPPCGVSGAVHPASTDPVPPLRSDAGAAAPSHAVQTLLSTKPALQAALRTRLHTARGESAVELARA